jgi:hypothetical protein
VIQFDAEVRVSEQNQQFHTRIPERSYLTCSKIMARICCDLVRKIPFVKESVKWVHRLTLLVLTIFLLREGQVIPESENGLVKT